jgi:hypothetical protein
MEDDVAVEGVVVGTNRGGIIVEMENIRGFCPGSQLGQRVQTFEELMERRMSFKVRGCVLGGGPADLCTLGCAHAAIPPRQLQSSGRSVHVSSRHHSIISLCPIAFA